MARYIINIPQEAYLSLQGRKDLNVAEMIIANGKPIICGEWEKQYHKIIHKQLFMITNVLIVLIIEISLCHIVKYVVRKWKNRGKTMNEWKEKEIENLCKDLELNDVIIILLDTLSKYDSTLPYQFIKNAESYMDNKMKKESEGNQ